MLSLVSSNGFTGVGAFDGIKKDLLNLRKCTRKTQARLHGKKKWVKCAMRAYGNKNLNYACKECKNIIDAAMHIFDHENWNDRFER